MIAAALYPRHFGHAEAIRLFLERYHLCHRQVAADKVRGWKAASLAAAFQAPAAISEAHRPANSPGSPAVRQGSQR